MTEPRRSDRLSADAGPVFGPDREIIVEARRRQAEELGRLIRRVMNPLGRALGAFARHLREAQTMRELASLDDRVLADIGLKREDIPAFVMQGRIVRAHDEEIVRAAAPMPEPPKADAVAVDEKSRIAA